MYEVQIKYELNTEAWWRVRRLGEETYELECTLRSALRVRT